MPAPHHSIFYRPGDLPDAQPTVSMHWREMKHEITTKNNNKNVKKLTVMQTYGTSAPGALLPTATFYPATSIISYTYRNNRISCHTLSIKVACGKLRWVISVINKLSTVEHFTVDDTAVSLCQHNVISADHHCRWIQIFSSVVSHLESRLTKHCPIWPTPSVFGASIGVTQLQFHSNIWCWKSRSP